MTTKATLNLEGFSDYLETLAKAAVDIDQVAEEALAAGAAVIVGGMRRRAPFEIIRTAISMTGVHHDGNKVWMYLGVLRGTDSETARIANVWEFGGRDSPSPKNRKRIPRPGIVAHPYIRPALRQDSKAARAAEEEVFQEWLK
jgi:hypothetical protein